MHFLEELAKTFPEDRLLIDKELLSPYESDGLTAFAVTPRAVLIPETQEEVVEIVRACVKHKVPFVSRGSGTSLSGAALPVETGIVIALNRLNRVIELDPERRIARVEPGVVNIDVTKAAQVHGLHFAPDPSSQIICTIGGNVAFNSGGAHCLKYGMTSNHVLGLKAVLATGEVVEFGNSSLEDTGPDYTGLFGGSEGMFGVALEIILRLLPKSETFHTILAGYNSLEKAGDAVSAIVASGILPGAIEIMDRLAIDAAEAAVDAGYPEEAKAVLIVELEGPQEQVESEKRELETIINASNPIEIQVAKDTTARLKIWKGRKSAFSAVGRLSPDFIVQDGVVPRKRLGEALRRIEQLGKKHGLRVANVFHAGDGNLHPLILYDGTIEGELERGENLAGEILEMCIEMGGSITGEHGVGMEKRSYMPKMFTNDDISFMKKTRTAFDPDGIANPGKMFPEGQAPALTLYGLHPLEKKGIISRE
ncbi:MAG: FAD-binding protein [Opitutae bacterium]|nr:FAD-binding protein [Opitutae bacterium]MBT4225055.1 FAD-binding protein [Opitutae bacterium]MBT5380693.1 FAD-binding protein [Opitutae bacterium]MBT5690839.1 FAD-binding protein [Opitutae bacterium]MBT6463872.1 FAD-binding protein [Opitutae bacterium]